MVLLHGFTGNDGHPISGVETELGQVGSEKFELYARSDMSEERGDMISVGKYFCRFWFAYEVFKIMFFVCFF